MSGYTPDTEFVAEQYSRERPPHIGTVTEKRAEFNRWLADVKAAVWDEGHFAGEIADRYGKHLSNPHREPDQ